MRLSDFKALTFDCYGTLIDWETGMVAALKPLTDRADRADRALGRNEILEAHAFQESTAQRISPAKPYPELLAVVYKRLAEEWGVPANWEECLAYGASVRDWPAFEDSAESLRYLKRHYRLIVLSNVDNASFAHSNRKLEVEFDAIYTAADIGSYKPAPRNFEYMLEQLARHGIARGDILHTAESLFHDHGPANDFGLANCWIYRRHGEAGAGATMPLAERPRTDFKFHSLADFVAAHKAELAAA